MRDWRRDARSEGKNNINNNYKYSRKTLEHARHKATLPTVQTNTVKGSRHEQINFRLDSQIEHGPFNLSHSFRTLRHRRRGHAARY